MDRKRHIAVIVALVFLSCLVQVVAIRRATVPSLDAVEFAALARQIDQHGLTHLLHSQRQQPLFPAWVWLVQEGLRGVVGECSWLWAASVQLAAAIPLVLSVVPVYLLSLRLLGPAAAVAGSLLFCVLPEVSRLGADGISDSVHLLFFALAFWAVVMYLTPKRPEVHQQQSGPSPRVAARGTAWLLACGMATAIALLARVEVLMLPVALLMVLGCFGFGTRRRASWSRLAAEIGCLAAGLALILVPYVVIAGCRTPRTAVARVLGRYAAAEGDTSYSTSIGPTDWRLAGGEPMSFARKEPTHSIRRRGYSAAVCKYGEELASAFGYWVGGLALLGAWRLRRRPVGPADRFIQVFFVCLSLVVIHFAAREGYLNSRHLLTLVVAGIGCAGCGALELGGLMAVGVGVLCRRVEQPGWAIPTVLSRWTAGWVVVLLAGGACVLRELEPLHGSRLGHRMAAQWLARCPASTGVVLDTRGWTGLYSGLTTCRYEHARRAFGDPRLAYVVLEDRELEFPSGRSRTLRFLLGVAAERAAAFAGPARPQRKRSAVFVYRWYPERFHRWVAAGTGAFHGKKNRHARGRPRVHTQRGRSL